jgi:hypothetical protein
MSEAKIILKEVLDLLCTPRIGVAQLTRQAFDGKDLRPLWHSLMEKVTDDAAGAGIGMDLSVISQLLGDQPTGLAMQAETLTHQTLFRSPCRAARPSLRVLAFAAALDIGANTPIEFLLVDSDVELITCYIVPGAPLPEHFPDHDIAIVIAPDSGASHAMLDRVAALAPAWPRPLLNVPEKIRGLDRDRLFRLLEGIAGLVIPPTARVSRQAVMVIAQGGSIGAFLPQADFPVIIRPVGSHAGFGLARITDDGALRAYLDDRGEQEFFLSPFVDYASPDEMFRKYRLVAIDGRPYACHMAIAEEWKVWYLNADMAVSVPNRLEEANFMQNFEQEFAARHHAALSEMIARIGLDYVIIDCAETKTGELLIFEADNAAIVHDMDPANVYPYKPPQMRRIFDAFAAMLYRRAGRAQSRAA